MILPRDREQKEKRERYCYLHTNKNQKFLFFYNISTIIGFVLLKRYNMAGLCAPPILDCPVFSISCKEKTFLRKFLLSSSLSSTVSYTPWSSVSVNVGDKSDHTTLVYSIFHASRFLAYS